MQAIACLKHAAYLAPFEWMVAFNLGTPMYVTIVTHHTGLAHLRTKQFASAFHHFSASVNLNAAFPPSFMLLGVALMHLNDYDNSIAALARAAEMEPCVWCAMGGV